MAQRSLFIAVLAFTGASAHPIPDAVSLAQQVLAQDPVTLQEKDSFDTSPSAPKPQDDIKNAERKERGEEMRGKSDDKLAVMAALRNRRSSAKKTAIEVKSNLTASKQEQLLSAHEQMKMKRAVAKAETDARRHAAQARKNQANMEKSVRAKMDKLANHELHKEEDRKRVRSKADYEARMMDSLQDRLERGFA
mmetsp:Transcript_2212/g.4947  ORF Transcript_2212/g.4947 Transcript_2212/m.4947 type:complete len:193 (+) Transcript_2212:66-644(+)